MSKTNETEKLEKEVVVNETEETTELAVPEEGEVKESKLKKAGKIAIKVAALAGAGLIGFILGTKTSKGNDELTDIDYEVSEEDTDENE